MTMFLGDPKVQYFKTGTSEFLSGGKVYTYDAGTLTARSTYPTFADAAASTNANANPVILDSRGEANIVIKGATKVILKDADDNTIWTVDNVDTSITDVVDPSSNEILKFAYVASAVNEITLTNAATGNSPIIEATGGDTNVGLKIKAKGSGGLLLDGGSTGAVDIGTTSTGVIGLKRNTAVTGTLTASGTITASGALSVVGLATVGSLSVTGNCNVVPTGSIMWLAVTSNPTGWLECSGQAVSRTTYATLFTAISTAFGSGDGSTTFNVPDLRRRTMVGDGGSGTATLANTTGSSGGEETHTMTTAELVAHTHTYTSTIDATQYLAGSISARSSTTTSRTTDSTGSSTPFNVMQPSLVMHPLIRYL